MLLLHFAFLTICMARLIENFETIISNRVQQPDFTNISVITPGLTFIGEKVRYETTPGNDQIAIIDNYYLTRKL